MPQSLYDRFRPFKPYDLVLAVVMLVLFASSTRWDLLFQALLVAAGLVLFWGLDVAQRRVFVPTPAWQAVAIIGLNTAGVTVMLYLHGPSQLGFSVYMLNVAFATVAFGKKPGIAAAALSIASLAVVDQLTETRVPYPEIEWVLMLVVLVSVSAILTRINRLQQDALFDALTDLRNHRYFQVRLREELKRTDRHTTPTCLLMLDLDDFKKVNDHFGHAVGDLVLREVSRVLERHARGTDVVCRYGGEELAVILPETTLADAVLVAERLREAVAQPTQSHGATVTISVGVAAYPEHAVRADDLIVAADTAMYAAKRAGKNRVLPAVPRLAKV